jgi:hypothetical protein
MNRKESKGCAVWVLCTLGGAILTPFVVFILRGWYINATDPHYRWDWDFAAIGVLNLGVLLGLTGGALLGFWLNRRINK